MNYGFLIRNDRCIGCHACSTACKAENQVPLGVHRTWVKTVEAGAFPDVRRHFQVTRCNHCADPPCVAICPTRAMYQRDDGIVEFDPDRCIGCKACLQACPYDAIHIDPASGTAAKCHFCGHRVELGLEPPCVVVCPEHAIIAGDLDDPDSEISRMRAEHRVTVRRPEKGTRPKLFYVDGEEASLHPGLAHEDAAGFAATERMARDGEGRPGAAGSPREEHAAGASAGPIQVGSGRMAGGLVRTAYDVEHRIPWHWPVPAYLITKGIAAGLFLLLAGGLLSGLVAFEAEGFLALGAVSLLFLTLTTGLLVADLERPERFLWVLLKPQSRSWLVRGAWVLMGFGGVAGGWWALELAAWTGWLPAAGAGEGAGVAALRPWLMAAGIPLAALAAVYTAFLFGQAHGRDLWLNPLLPARLLVQSVVAGSALVLVLAPALPLPPGLLGLAWWGFASGLAVNLLVFLPAEFGRGHRSDGAREAAQTIVRGRYRGFFWGGGVVLGHLLPLGLLAGAAAPGAAGSAGVAALGAAGSAGAAVGPGLAATPLAWSLAGLLALVGMYLFEHAYVMAPQWVRNS